MLTQSLQQEHQSAVLLSAWCHVEKDAAGGADDRFCKQVRSQNNMTSSKYH